MKKTFNLTHSKIKYPRMIEAVKHEIRKYIKRERRRELPAGVDFWDFDCRFGDTEAEAKVIHPAEIDPYINDAEQRGLTSFYVEILRKEGIRAAAEKVQREIDANIPMPKGFGEA
ncbi:hypothetical protein EGM51_05835 [Verrucomicrobia bacterium S94]|nr:hypothetical protein EGM51_05835 [Verrucomicrobia bacterium S94]